MSASTRAASTTCSEAVARGYFPVATLTAWPQFDALRDDPAFQTLLADAEAGRQRARTRFERPAASASSRAERRDGQHDENAGARRATRPKSFAACARFARTASRRWGRMSAHQMVCHLSDGYRLLTGSTPDAQLVATPLPRPMMKWIALYVPLRWPKGVPTTPELDQSCWRRHQTRSSSTRMSRNSNRLLGAIAHMPGDQFAGQRPSHSSDACPSRRGCDGRTCTPIIISVSSACRTTAFHALRPDRTTRPVSKEWALLRSCSPCTCSDRCRLAPIANAGLS